MKLVTPADRHLHLGQDDVHVWPTNLNIGNERLTLLNSYLSADERVRADRYHFPQDRSRFICARGVLRELLSAYSGQHPASIRFSYGQFGKPTAVQSSGLVPDFNYSRSANVALFAFTRERAIGVDIERIEDDEEFLSIAVQHYTHSENLVLNSLEKSAKMIEFFRYWTRREAYLKATGQGLIPSRDQTSRNVWD
jgi:4'-phosphopantetheinyl transferase